MPLQRASRTALLAAVPTILLGADTLAVRRIDDSTVAATLPMKSGIFPVKVVSGARVSLPGNVTLNGFHDELIGPLGSGYPYWMNQSTGGPPEIFLAANSGA